MQRTSGPSSSSTSFFSALTFNSRTEDAEVEGKSKGPFGLTTPHEPETRASSDVIFVHGLNGGSESTWTAGDVATQFWPKYWLPQESEFRHVRIHSFGYDSSLKRESVLNIQDFASSLLSAIQDCPSMSTATTPWTEGTTPLVFVGHSMGGLVIKKAYIIGRQDPNFHHVANRVSAIFFLATPHRGSETATMLSRILSLAGASRPFVNDLLPISPVLQSINEEFGLHADNLNLFSYYETRPMFYGTNRGLIVEKTCAVMNLKNERRDSMNANHRNVARYESPELLGIASMDTDDIDMQDQRRTLGTGNWLLERDSFKVWCNDSPLGARLMWLRGRPGAGKSFLAGRVVKHLREQRRDVCAFFFNDSDSGKTSASAFLRSMALQMAHLHPEILEGLSELLLQKQIQLDAADHSTVWRHIYVSCLLKIPLDRPQYWVLDAMDECKATADLLAYLGKAQEAWPQLSVFVTSRDSFESTTNSTYPDITVVTETIREEDSNSDIEAFLRSGMGALRSYTPEARDRLFDKVLDKSRGCFLWADITMKGLRQVAAPSEGIRVLDSNPTGMNDMYEKILHKMADMADGKWNRPITRSILAWVTCSSRPLTVDEMRVAIHVDLNEDVENVEHVVNLCCGDLVHISSKKRLRLLHLTAKEFLLDERPVSEFAVNKKEAHGRLAKACPDHLISQAQKRRPSTRSQGSGRLITLGSTRDPKSGDGPGSAEAFTDYASLYVFQHVHNATSKDDAFIRAMAAFFGSRAVLSWIEYIARRADLHRVFQAGKIVQNFLGRRSQHSPPIGEAGLSKDRQMLGRWGGDLVHLVTRFSKRIKLSPAVIQYLIPAICPSNSVIYEQFGLPSKGIIFQGLDNADWDECLTTIRYSKERKPIVSATGPGFVTLGTINHTVVLLDDVIFQDVKSLDHGEPVWCLTLGEQRRVLASAGARVVRVWSLEDWEEICTVQVKSKPLALSFVDEDETLAVVTKENQLILWDLHARQPTMASVSPYQGLLAVIYRGEDVLLWDLERGGVHDILEKNTGSRRYGSAKSADGATTVRAITFSAAPDTSLLATTYTDGDLIVYDTENGKVRSALPDQNAMILQSSPDGRTLAGGDTRGTILLYDFRTLKQLCRISFEATSVIPKSLSFTANGQRLVDIRPPQCRIWQPTVFLRQDNDAEDQDSDTASVSTNLQIIDHREDHGPRITAVACLHSLSVAITGREDSSVHLRDVSGGPDVGQQLFVQTPGCLITGLHFDDAESVLACSDASGRVTCRRLLRPDRRVPRTSKSRWQTSPPLFSVRKDVSTVQVLSSPRHNRLLVCSEECTDLWDMSSQGTLEAEGGEPVASLPGSRNARWNDGSVDEGTLLCASMSEIEVRSWTDMACLARIKLDMSSSIGVSIDRLVPLHHGRYVVTVTEHHLPSGSTAPVAADYQLWDCRSFKNESSFPIMDKKIRPVCNLGPLAEHVERITGLHGGRLIYVDTAYWVCSVEVPEPGQPLGTQVRHFFIPSDWLSCVSGLLVDVDRFGEIALVKQSELVIVKRGLEATEDGTPLRVSTGAGRTSSLASARPRPSVLPGRYAMSG
ncbi:hypothetical protein CPLU01_13784 [Colletotrichum plurivorum]|uniref:GPI inositol-deacylase n=1 Tax=Colletotrichum plurivorum TaxID=2175906 RepID=A0A8H6JNY5_9PEZI|nr:hypothetical protein CPLU01_13784 [Colletotrichum plurivorum]